MDAELRRIDRLLSIAYAVTAFGAGAVIGMVTLALLGS